MRYICKRPCLLSHHGGLGHVLAHYFPGVKQAHTPSLSSFLFMYIRESKTSCVPLPESEMRNSRSADLPPPLWGLGGLTLRISGSGMNARGLTPDQTGQEEKLERGAYTEQLGPAPAGGGGEEESADHTDLSIYIRPYKAYNASYRAHKAFNGLISLIRAKFVCMCLCLSMCVYVCLLYVVLKTLLSQTDRHG